LVGLLQWGVLSVPIVGVAKSGWNVGSTRRRRRPRVIPLVIVAVVVAHVVSVRLTAGAASSQKPIIAGTPAEP
jgi:hypothetical protein